MKTCVIIGAAPCENLDFIDKEILNNAFVIAADGGYTTACNAGVKVNAFIGDLDSNMVAPNCDDLTILPCVKDCTDVHTAILRAISDGYKKIILVGCTNGRADHYFANVALLELIAKNGAEGVIVDGGNEIRFISEGMYRVPRSKRYFSILPIDEEITGVTLIGFKYLLDKATLYRDYPSGVSNEWVRDIATVVIESGRALMIFSEDNQL